MPAPIPLMAPLAALALMGEPTEPGRLPPDTGYLPPHALPSEPIFDDELDEAARPPEPPGTEPGTRVAGRLLELLDELLAATADLPDAQHRYDHRFRVNRTEGIYHWDCSQMLSWVLSRRAPRAWAAVGTDRPVAWHYFRVIVEAPSHSYEGGWRQIDSVEDVLPGDVFAWHRPDSWPMGASSGHVGVVRSTPVAVPTLEGAYLVRIIDSTSEPHQDDDRGEGHTGLGEGTMLLMTDADGAVTAYGWEGLHSKIWVRTDLVFGRAIY